jgi:hypothetical protein
MPTLQQSHCWPLIALRFTNQPSVHSDHGCQEGCAGRPREAARTLQYGSHAPHRHECEKHMRHCHGRLPLLCAPVLRPPSTHSACWPLLHTCDWLKLSPRPARDAINTISFTCWSRHKRAMCTCSLRSRVRPMPLPAMHARWVPEGFRPRRPRMACLCGCVNLFTSSLVLCLPTSVYPAVVTSWRPTRLTSGCNHAQKGSPVPPNGLLYITYG